MEKALAEEGPWLLGGSYSLADICVAPLIDRMEDLGYESLWEADLPHVTRWFKTIKDRPAYLTAYYHGTRYSEVFPDLELGRRNADVAGSEPFLRNCVRPLRGKRALITLCLQYFDEVRY